MKNYIYVFLCFSMATPGCNKDSKSQVDSSKGNTLGGNGALKIRVDSSYSYDQFKESITKVYVDSLNPFRKGSKLPSFLMDTDLEVNSEVNSWPNSNFVSLREEIFKKVNNIDLLKEVAQNPYFQHQFLNTGKKRAKIQSDSTSNYKLALERLTILSKR